MNSGVLPSNRIALSDWQAVNLFNLTRCYPVLISLLNTPTHPYPIGDVPPQYKSAKFTELGASLFKIAQSLLSEPLFRERWRSVRIRAVKCLGPSVFGPCNICCSHLHKNTNQTVDFMALGLMSFMRGLDITWPIWKSPVLGPNPTRCRSSNFRAQYRLNFQTNSSNVLHNVNTLHKTHKNPAPYNKQFD